MKQTSYYCDRTGDNDLFHFTFELRLMCEEYAKPQLAGEDLEFVRDHPVALPSLLTMSRMDASST